MVCLPSNLYGFKSHYPYMNSVNFLHNIKQFFIKKGKKSIIENRLQKEITLRSYLDETKSLKKAEKTEDLNSLFQSCWSMSIPYVRLKIKKRRRGKRILYRVKFLTSVQSEQRALTSFNKFFKTIKANNFLNKMKLIITSFSKFKWHIIQKERKKLHRLAYKNYSHIYSKFFYSKPWLSSIKQKLARKEIALLPNKKQFFYLYYLNKNTGATTIKNLILFLTFFKLLWESKLTSNKTLIL